MPGDFREDIKDVIHSVNMLFFGRGKLIELSVMHRRCVPISSGL